MQEITGIVVPTSSLFDIQIKRIHEYKRQYMNLVSIIARYIKIKEASPEERKEIVPRVCIFGGKAASAYYMAKKIVRLVTAIGETVNNDPEVGDLLKVNFATHYKKATLIILFHCPIFQQICVRTNLLGKNSIGPIVKRHSDIDRSSEK